MSGYGVHVDDLTPKLNECRQRDLMTILDLTPPRYRVSVALAFAGWSQEDWATEAGICRKSISLWMRCKNRMPLGAAYRLARVMGADPFQLFQQQLEMDASPTLYAVENRA